MFKRWFLNPTVIAIWLHGANGLAQDHPPEWEQGIEALQILGADIDGASDTCSRCHALNSTTLRRWQESTWPIAYSCNIGSNESSAQDKLDCIRNLGEDPEVFEPDSMGFYTAAVHLDLFSDLFREVYPDDTEFENQYNIFKNEVAMPIDEVNALTQEQWDKVLAYVLSGMNHMERILGEVGPPPTTCTPGITDTLRSHIDEMALSGWGAMNRERSLQMFACDGPAGGPIDPLSCFQQRDSLNRDVFPDVSSLEEVSWRATVPEARMRILRLLDFHTSYWMRASADGRFVGNGGGNRLGSTISDLSTLLVEGAGFRDIAVDASYDPSFFPDNAGFVFQGGGGGTGICWQSLLENPGTVEIRFDEEECARSGSFGLYQAVGASLDGSDYLAVVGSFAGNGGGSTHTSEEPYWVGSGRLSIVPFIHDGTAFQVQDEVQFVTPYEGDWNISPSNKLLIGRLGGEVGGDQVHLGFNLYLLNKTVTESGYQFSYEPVATICQKGAKGKFSFDESAFTTFHYVDKGDYQQYGFDSAEDPAFLHLLEKGTADIYVFDLRTGISTRITNMGAGQFALFPHYRADGWIYFMVWNAETGQRYIAATDAGIRLSR